MIPWTLLAACTNEEVSFLETWGCGIESQIVVGPEDSFGPAPPAEVVIAGLDGVQRAVSFQRNVAGFAVTWSDVVSFSMALGGEVRAAALSVDPELPSARDCVDGDFLFAEVEVGLSGQHFSGVLPGVIRWRGPDLDEDLWLVLEQGQVDADTWLSGLGDQLVEQKECDPFTQVEIGSYDYSDSGTWEHLDLDVWAAGNGCWLTLAQAAWLDAAPLPEG